jgi:hypothetical protein
VLLLFLAEPIDKANCLALWGLNRGRESASSGARQICDQTPSPPLNVTLIA